MRLSYAEAMARAVREVMTEDHRAFLIGNSFAGVSLTGRAAFGSLVQDFADRVVSTAVAELGLAGAATGAALAGCRPLVDLGAGSFSLHAWAQLVNEAPNIHYMSGGQAHAPVTFYCLIGIRGAGGSQHSHRTQAMLGNIPGLQLLLPATPGDAYQMLKWALQESLSPTVYLSHALLLDDVEDVDLDARPLPVGKARVAREGRDVTVVAHSVMVRTALAAADLLAREHDVAAEVVDMRTLSPLDRETMIASVVKTGRAVIADECNLSFGAGAELAATLAQDAFHALKAPVYRVATPDVPIPYSPPLESALVVTAEKIAHAVVTTIGHSLRLKHQIEKTGTRHATDYN